MAYMSLYRSTISNEKPLAQASSLLTRPRLLPDVVVFVDAVLRRQRCGPAEFATDTLFISCVKHSPCNVKKSYCCWWFTLSRVFVQPFHLPQTVSPQLTEYHQLYGFMFFISIKFEPLFKFISFHLINFNYFINFCQFIIFFLTI